MTTVPENLKLWLISQTENGSYNTFDSAVVAADTAEQARLIHPGGGGVDYWAYHIDKDNSPEFFATDWATKPENVTVKLIGVANPFEVTNGEVVCSSFNAG